MAIDGALRDKLEPETKLVARYKGKEHRAEVVAGEDGKVRAALVGTFADRSLAGCREILLLKGVTLATREDYWVLGAFQDHAGRLGYPVLQ